MNALLKRPARYEAGRISQRTGVGLGGLFGHGCGRRAGRGAVSVRERGGVPLVCVGLGHADFESEGACGVCVEAGDVLDFAVRFVVHEGDMEEADVTGLWGDSRGGGDR